MTISEDQYILAHNMLVVLKKWGGQRFDHADVQRLAEALAKRTWLEDQLNQLTTNERMNHEQP